jgi:hypothetical protein
MLMPEPLICQGQVGLLVVLFSEMSLVSAIFLPWKDGKSESMGSFDISAGS